jgi:hypothetical protein
VLVGSVFLGAVVWIRKACVERVDIFIEEVDCRGVESEPCRQFLNRDQLAWASEDRAFG